MRYREILKQLPAPFLEQIVLQNGLFQKEVRGRYQAIETPALLPTLLAFFEDPERIFELLKELTPEEKTALRIVQFGAGNSSAMVSLCEERLNAFFKEREKCRAAWKNLKAKGLVFQGKGAYGREFYFLPKEVVYALIRLSSGELEVLPPAEVTAVTNHHSAFLYDLFSFLAFLRATPAPLARTGHIYRRVQKQIQLSFRPLPGNEEEKAAYFQFLVRVAWWLKLIRMRENVVTLTKQAEAWVNKPYIEQVGEIFSFWKSRELIHSPWGADALSLLFFAPPGAWVGLKNLYNFLGTYCLLSYWEGVKSYLGSLWEQLLWLGCFEYARGKEERVIRLTPVGRFLWGKELGLEGTLDFSPWEETFLIQPNFEILVPENIAPYLIWELQLMANLVQADRVLLFRLSRDSFYRALKVGKSPAEAISFLVKHSKYPLPQNVAFSLQEWGKEYGRLYLFQALLLRCRDEQLATEIKASSRFAPYILGEITPRDLIVSERSAPELLQLLEKEGYFPRPGVLSLEPDDDEEEETPFGRI